VAAPNVLGGDDTIREPGVIQVGSAGRTVRWPWLSTRARRRGGLAHRDAPDREIGGGAQGGQVDSEAPQYLPGLSFDVEHPDQEMFRFDLRVAPVE
jgi:hypothetical protein